MILDALLKVCAAQAITADAVSVSSIDFGNITPKRKMGVGTPMGYLVAISAKGTTTGSSKIQAIESAAAALTSPQVVGELDLAAADHAVGKCFIIALSSGIPALRYGGLNFDITGTVDYTVDAFFGPLEYLAIQADTYAKGYSM